MRQPAPEAPHSAPICWRARPLAAAPAAAPATKLLHSHPIDYMNRSLLSRQSLMSANLPLHLRRLESEAIHIMREVVAEFSAPVMLYSIGKDSSAMLHVALKAFHPAPPPFPFLHVDTTWKFREMIAFRDQRVRELGLELLVHVNRDGLASGIGPLATVRRAIPTS